jgi:hypothetical protein
MYCKANILLFFLVLSYVGGAYILFGPVNDNINQRIPSFDTSLPISDSNHDTVGGIK